LRLFLARGINPRSAIQKVAQKNRQKIRLSQLIKQDTEWCALRYRPRTVEANQLAMKKLIEWGDDTQICDVNEKHIEGFLRYLSNDFGHSGTSINMHLRQLKALFQRTVTK